MPAKPILVIALAAVLLLGGGCKPARKAGEAATKKAAKAAQEQLGAAAQEVQHDGMSPLWHLRGARNAASGAARAGHVNRNSDSGAHPCKNRWGVTYASERDSRHAWLEAPERESVLQYSGAEDMRWNPELPDSEFKSSLMSAEEMIQRIRETRTQDEVDAPSQAGQKRRYPFADCEDDWENRYSESGISATTTAPVGGE